jgi:hypothetical protein
VGALEQQLAQDIDDHGQGDEGQRADQSESPDGLGRAALAKQVNKTRKETHDEDKRHPSKRQERMGEEEGNGGELENNNLRCHSR